MFKSYQVKYITYGLGNSGPKMYGVLRIKSDRGWVVEVWPCDAYGSQVSDPVEWKDGLDRWAAIKLFWKYYFDYDKYVNDRV
jgi:hypothetical protein